MLTKVINHTQVRRLDMIRRYDGFYFQTKRIAMGVDTYKQMKL